MAKCYTKEEKEIIEKMKEYLKNIRALTNEKFSLELEYNDIPEPQSPKISDEAPGGYSKPKDHQMNSLISKRDLLFKRIQLFNQELDKFMFASFLLKKGHRSIIECYINSRSYNEMISMLEDDYCISESTYNRKIPEICLELSKYVDYRNPVTVSDVNQAFLQWIRKSDR